MPIAVTIDKFKDALHLLDNKLVLLNDDEFPQRVIYIKAIGGFALLYHSVRTTGVTGDIDTITPDYPASVIRCIQEVSEELSMNDDWLNNYNVLDNDVATIEQLLDPFWESVDYGLKSIILWVADLETLLRSKLIAAEDDRITNRIQDIDDVREILKKLNCITLEQVLEYCKKIEIDLLNDYPWNYSRLLKVFPDV